MIAKTDLRILRSRMTPDSGFPYSLTDVMTEGGMGMSTREQGEARMRMNMAQSRVNKLRLQAGALESAFSSNNAPKEFFHTMMDDVAGENLSELMSFGLSNRGLVTPQMMDAALAGKGSFSDIVRMAMDPSTVRADPNRAHLLANTLRKMPYVGSLLGDRMDRYISLDTRSQTAMAQYRASMTSAQYAMLTGKGVGGMQAAYQSAVGGLGQALESESQMLKDMIPGSAAYFNQLQRVDQLKGMIALTEQTDIS